MTANKPIRPGSRAPKEPVFSASLSANLIISNGMQFLRVERGEFLMGSAEDDPSRIISDEQPQHVVNIPYDYWIARVPVSNEMYNSYVEAQGISHPVENWNDKEDHPVVGVTWDDAMSFCQWLNVYFWDELPSDLVFRLPTEAEWEKAARGTDGRRWPWGNDWDRAKCSLRGYRKEGTFPIGLCSPQGDSVYGCVDMAGNVWEWTHSVNRSYPYKSDDGRENENGSASRIRRGGSWKQLAPGVRCAFRPAAKPDYSDDELGFRVVISCDLSEKVDFAKRFPEKFSLPFGSRVEGINDLNQHILSNGLELRYVPAGQFLMGDKDLHLQVVSIPYDYWMARFPVTNELYDAFLDTNGVNKPSLLRWKRKNHPVVNVSWNDATAYCDWLNEVLRDEIPAGLVLRLPTEAEWEKAARGTDGRKFPWGNEFDQDKFNSLGNGKRGTRMVGYYSPFSDSPYGCADMVGNVYEWTHSLAMDYPYHVNDTREDEGEGNRVLRGDYFMTGCTFRLWSNPNGVSAINGFRVAMAPPITEVIEIADKTGSYVKKTPEEIHAKQSSLSEIIKFRINPFTPVTDSDLLFLGKTDFVLIPRGSFDMGSGNENQAARDNERPRHKVSIPYDYWIARFPITNYLYEIYVKSKKIQHPVHDWENKPNYPVENVSWIEASEFCKWLTALLKREPSSNLVFRLPTEAEWEKAARGTDSREWPWGNEFQKANCNLKESSTPAGSYSPQGDSPYGCGDMGNVIEWTHSKFESYPYRMNDGREKAERASSRVVRGGNDDSKSGFARCAWRMWCPVITSGEGLSFRVVLAPMIDR